MQVNLIYLNVEMFEVSLTNSLYFDSQPALRYLLKSIYEKRTKIMENSLQCTKITLRWRSTTGTHKYYQASCFYLKLNQ